jgi:UDP-galactopyranose mutase
MDLKHLKYLVVGSGFYGSVIAERIANDLDEHVVIIDKRAHIGGNCFSETDIETGIEYHKYGTHIFHTSIRNVWNYINRFTEFNGYRHQVLSSYQGRIYQMPINLETINAFYGLNLRPFEVAEFLKSEIVRENIGVPKNLEEKAISQIGRSLYEAFIKGYTKKQWQKDPRFLPASIIERLPLRYNYNESYFFDPWQGIPANGYTAIFKKLLTNRKIENLISTDYFSIKGEIPSSCLIIYSGPIDSFFNYDYGKLEWRTLEFKNKIIGVEDFQGTSVMNYPEISVPYTRIHEPRHLHIERPYLKEKTLIIYEYPKFGLAHNPLYPVNTSTNQNILEKYIAKANCLKNVIIGGRLGDYQYYDMDRVIDLALKTYEEKIKVREGHQ